MRRLILAAAGLALLVPAALAQTAPAAPASGAAPAVGQAAPAGQPGTPGPVAGGPAVPPPPPGGPRGPGMMPPPPPPPPSRAAHFHLQRGDAVVDVKCADDDSAKTCADTVNAMLDKLASLPAPARN